MTMTITINSDNALIDVPYSARFVERIKRLGGRWMPDQKKWAVDARNVEHVRAAMVACYGRSDASVDDLVTVRVTVGDKGIVCSRGSIEMFGRVVARAFDRDGGARTGDGIVFVEGGADSNGSVKYWQTIIYAESIFLIRDVPRQHVLANRAAWIEQGHQIEIEEQVVAVDRAQLMSERERLAARIAEIDRLLDSAQ